MVNVAKFMRPDRRVEENGQWFEIYIANGESFGIFSTRPSRDRNVQFKMTYERLVRERHLQKRIDKDTITPEENVKLILDACIQGCMKKFRDIEMPWGENGELIEVEFSVEAAERFFEECPTAFQRYLEMAAEEEAWLEVEREDAAKN